MLQFTVTPTNGGEIEWRRVALGFNVAFLIEVQDKEDIEINASFPLEEDDDIETAKAQTVKFLEYIVECLRNGEVAA